MTIQPKLRKSILDFLTPLPFLQSENGRRALLLSAGLDTVLPSIDLSGSATEFASRLVEDLDQYGTLPAEQPALIRFLQEIKTQVGQDRQETLQTFCDQLQRPRAEIVTQCPYRGLFAFREEDEAYFFGRAAYTQKLLEAVNEKPLIAVIGASGSGKSSVVCAGLIPRLRRQGNWCIAAFRPGESPFRALSAAVIPFLEADLDEIDKIKAIKKLSHELSAGDLALSDITAAILQKHPATRLLLFADQFEELYTLCRADDERRRFLDGLIATFRTDRAGTLTCVLTMRADFLGKALSYRPFGDACKMPTCCSAR